jgi:SAM-dependent methyltransferase
MPAALGRTLELGSGMGVMARRIAGRTRLYIGIDLTTAQALALRPLGGRGLVADIHALPFPGAAFDTIIADNVIEHAVDPLAVLIECHRVLRPGGRAFLVIPPDYASAAFRNSAHFWKADVSSVCYALERAGFTVMRHETVRLAELGVSGAFPSSQGATDLWQVEKPSPHGGMRGAGGSR